MVALDGCCHCRGCRWSWLTSSVVSCGPCGEGVLTCGCIAVVVDGDAAASSLGCGCVERNLDLENFGVLLQITTLRNFPSPACSNYCTDDHSETTITTQQPAPVTPSMTMMASKVSIPSPRHPQSITDDTNHHLPQQ